MSTTRTDDDSWDIAPSIGATAVRTHGAQPIAVRREVAADLRHD
jgi:hypothetical protein